MTNPVTAEERLNALETEIKVLREERDSIQHKEIAAAQVEFNAMRTRAEAAERELAVLRPVLEQLKQAAFNAANWDVWHLICNALAEPGLSHSS